MSEPRRRIVRRAVMALAGVVLALTCYVGSAGSIILATQAGWIPKAVTDSKVPRFYATPLLWYSYSAKYGVPGSSIARSIVVWSYDTGREMRKP